MGYSRVLIEGGGKTITSFLKLGLVDSISLFQSYKILGGDSYNSVGDLNLQSMEDVPQFSVEFSKKLGNDRYTFLSRSLKCLQEL